jgi:hypothetical protein
LICDACASRTGAKDHHADILHLNLADMQSRHHGSESNASSALDIIIKAGNLRLIPVQDATGVVETKVFATYIY